MSDIEDYAYSPYDDLEDILWDADPAPELADDLAGHAIHSPVYNDEDGVKNELQEYFSDWEYYSDDYMDDDPSLLRTNPQDGSPMKKATNLRQHMKRGKKRKLADTQDIPLLTLDEDQLLTRCIKGTIWSRPSEPEVPHYRDGQEKSVALMKNWKDQFARKNNGWGRSSEEEDESWANDMSLADMGLRNVARQSSFVQDTEQGEGEMEEEEEVLDPAEDEDMAEDLSEEVAEEMATTLAEENTQAQIVPRSGSSKLRHSMLIEDDGGGTPPEELATDTWGDDEGPRKRRRVKPALPSPPDSNSLVAVSVDDSAGLHKTKTAVITKSEAPDASGKKVIQTGTISVVQNKKRKATNEPEDAVARSTASSRAKRVASTRATQDQPQPTTARTTRGTKTK